MDFHILAFRFVGHIVVSFILTYYFFHSKAALLISVDIDGSSNIDGLTNSTRQDVVLVSGYVLKK